MTFNNVYNFEKKFIDQLDIHGIDYSYLVNMENIDDITTLKDNQIVLAHNKYSTHSLNDKDDHVYVKAKFKHIDCLKHYINTISDQPIPFDYMPSIISLLKFMKVFLELKDDAKEDSLITLIYSNKILFRQGDLTYHTEVIFNDFRLFIGDNILIKSVFFRFNKQKNFQINQVNFHAISSYLVSGSDLQSLYNALLSLGIKKMSTVLGIDREHLSYKSLLLYKMMVY